MLRVLRDVVIQQASPGEVVVVAREPGVVGDMMTIEMTEPEAAVRTKVQVVESLPVVSDGAVRHLLRLRPVDTVGALGGLLS